MKNIVIYCIYLIDYIADGPQFPHQFWNSPKSAKTCIGINNYPSPGPTVFESPGSLHAAMPPLPGMKLNEHDQPFPERRRRVRTSCRALSADRTPRDMPISVMVRV